MATRIQLAFPVPRYLLPYLKAKGYCRTPPSGSPCLWVTGKPFLLVPERGKPHQNYLAFTGGNPAYQAVAINMIGLSLPVAYGLVKHWERQFRDELLEFVTTRMATGAGRTGSVRAFLAAYDIGEDDYAEVRGIRAVERHEHKYPYAQKSTAHAA